MKRTVVARKALPTHWPIMLTWAGFASQEIWVMPGWGIGVMWTMIVIVWLIVVVDVFSSEYRDPFEKGP